LNVRLAALLLALFAAAPATASEPEPLKRSELTTLSEEALARRIFGPLASDLYVTNMTREGGRRWSDAWVWFWTTPRKDWLRAGLCVADRMIVRLTPDRLAIGENPAMRIASVQTETVYIVRDREMATRLSGFDPKELEGQDQACAKLDPRRNSIPAESGWQLMSAFEMVKKLGDAARAGRAPAPIDCSRLNFNRDPPASEAECLAEFKTLGETSVASTRECADSIVSGTYCIRVQTFDSFIYFVLRWKDQEMERVIVQGVEDTSAIE
jgi:hypothetical protein